MLWLFLLGALLSAAAAYLVGAPAWSSYRGREARDLNAERYLAWRGRANEARAGDSMREGPTPFERRRLWLAAALALAALGLLVAFFAAT